MENEIKQIISDVSKVAITKVHEDAELGNDLAIDSLDLLDVVTELEKNIKLIFLQKT
ncbi:acyl carrier protein [Brochothrix thermosphacta]|uniref:acyl carrier protein n=1 Tax=Brochothrix thermosphacta TaxID=2756 RepID=UPI000D7A2D38